MVERAHPPEDFRRGLVGLYALSVMEKEGPVHGYRVAERIAERTEGAWRPGPGAVYPALQKLAARGLARPRARSIGRRREFEITSQGRKALQRIRARGSWSQQAGIDLAPLWSEVSGAERFDEFLQLRLRRALEALEVYLGRHAALGEPSTELQRSVEEDLQRFLDRIRRGTSRATAPILRPGSRSGHA